MFDSHVKADFDSMPNRAFQSRKRYFKILSWRSSHKVNRSLMFITDESNLLDVRKHGSVGVIIKTSNDVNKN